MIEDCHNKTTSGTWRGMFVKKMCDLDVVQKRSFIKIKVEFGRIIRLEDFVCK